jgi:MFS family permease
MHLSTQRLVALQHRDFRLLWLGQLVSITGSQMQIVAVDWHIYQLLRGQTYTLELFGWTIPLQAEALGLGLLGLVRVLPIILLALLGGVLADTRDRRQLMIWTQGAASFFAALLAIITLTGYESVAAIYLLTAAGAAAMAFDNPARQSIVPNLVPREHLSNAVSLNTLMWQIATIAAPALAGLLVGTFNIGLVYVLNALSFVAVLIALLMMRYRGQAAAQNTSVGWPALVEGLRFTYKSRLIWSTMLLDFFATFFSSARVARYSSADWRGFGRLYFVGAPRNLSPGGCITSQCGPLWAGDDAIWRFDYLRSLLFALWANRRSRYGFYGDSSDLAPGYYP